MTAPRGFIVDSPSCLEILHPNTPRYLHVFSVLEVLSHVLLAADTMHVQRRRIRFLRTTVFVTLAITCASGTAAHAEGDVLSLGSVDSIPDAPVTTSGTTASVAESESNVVVPGAATNTPDVVVLARRLGAAATDTDTAGTPDDLRARRDELATARDRLTAAVESIESTRERAAEQLDAADAEIATRMSNLLSTPDTMVIATIIQARTTDDAQVRAQLIALLPPADVRRFAALDQATRRDEAAQADADSVRSAITSLSARIDTIDAALRAGTGHTIASGGDAVDADLVFATGPIPAIGYWGTGATPGAWSDTIASAYTGMPSPATCAPPDPELIATQNVQVGEASWYGPGFDGQGTANGETYDQEALTAAHRTLPFGTIVKVTSQSSGSCVFVRINDRGPYVDGRIIDLSHAAAQSIGMDGTAPVQVQVYALPGAAAPDPNAAPAPATP